MKILYCGPTITHKVSFWRLKWSQLLRKFVSQNKAKNAGRSRKNAGMREIHQNAGFPAWLRDGWHLCILQTVAGQGQYTAALLVWLAWSLMTFLTRQPSVLDRWGRTRSILELCLSPLSPPAYPVHVCAPPCQTLSKSPTRWHPSERSCRVSSRSRRH